MSARWNTIAPCRPASRVTGVMRPALTQRDRVALSTLRMRQASVDPIRSLCVCMMSEHCTVRYIWQGWLQRRRVGWGSRWADLTDRLSKALRHAGLSVQDMADYFDVHRNTVSGWIHGRIRPDTRTLRLWAARTGVPYEWLRDGTFQLGPDQPVGKSIWLFDIIHPANLHPVGS